MNSIVEYITALVDGFEEALTEETVIELYQEHLAFLVKYNTYLDTVIVPPKSAYKSYRKPITLAFYKKHHLRATITYKLMDSELQCYFEDLTYQDIMKIVGNGMTKSDIAKIEHHVRRLLSRHEYKDKFDSIQELIYSLNE